MGLSFRSSPAALLVVSTLSLCFPSETSGQPRRNKDELIGGRAAAAGEVLVRFRQDAFTLTLSDNPDVDRDDRLGSGAWHLIHSRSRAAAALLAALRLRSDVVKVEPNYRVSTDGAPNDLVASLWGLNNTGQAIGDGTRGTPGADISAVRAWNTTTGARSIVVAAIDTGIMTAHQDLSANLWSAPRPFTVTIGGSAIMCAAGTHGFNAINKTCVPADDNGHGTHVAGSIGAAGGNGVGVVGVNWTTSIMALKFLDATGTGYVSDAIDAIEFAIQAKRAFASSGAANVRILNSSWSGGDYSQALSDEIQRAADSDMLFVAAAGNGAVDLDTQPAYPSSYTGSNIIAVGSTDDRDNLSSFSNYGVNSVHLAAPGTSIYSTYVFPTDPATSAYATMSGTSMATAYVSGAAALVLAKCPYSTGALRNALLSSATTLSALDGRVQSGRRLNAAAAVESCSGTSASASEIVLRAADDVPASARHGAWTLTADATAAGGAKLATPDVGWASTTTPLPSPSDYVDVIFSAPAGVAYHLWLRLHAAGNSKWNDSVWVQFSDALANGSPAFAINTTSGYAVNLENCSGCGVAGWGWQDGSYWLPRSTVTFASAGSHTMRLQTREDGVEIDQIVLSPAAYLSASPGSVENDTTILGSSSGGAAGPPPSSPPSAPSPTPFSGAAITLPGVVDAASFDNGGERVGYHDTTSGNAGGAFRQTDVDVEPSVDGSYSVGWIEPGEWLRYSVNVAAAGDYIATIRLASPGGGATLRIAFDANGTVNQVSVPATGGWQNWTTVNVPVTLQAGLQSLHLLFDTSGFNVRSVAVSQSGSQLTALAPFGGSARAVPGVIQAADFDSGGEGVAYHDASSGNSGGAYRQTDVDLAASSEGGYTIGWIDAAEWVNYTVNVAAAGNYTVKLRVAAPAAGGLLHIGFNSASSVWKQLAVPATGDWQRWTTISVPVTLGPGQQQLTLFFDTAGFNVSSIAVEQP